MEVPHDLENPVNTVVLVLRKYQCQRIPFIPLNLLDALQTVRGRCTVQWTQPAQCTWRTCTLCLCFCLSESSCVNWNNSPLETARSDPAVPGLLQHLLHCRPGVNPPPPSLSLSLSRVCVVVPPSPFSLTVLYKINFDCFCFLFRY